MTTREMKRELKIREWTAILAARESSGMKIDAWCETQGISRNAYFYWQRIIRDRAWPGQIVTAETAVTSTAEAAETPVFARIDLAPRDVVSAGISIRVGEIEVNISPDSNDNHVRMLLEAITHA